MFGLHPQMAPLEWLWDSGELAAVHAVGLPVPNRSHFSAMEEVEDADPGSIGPPRLDQPDDRAGRQRPSRPRPCSSARSIVPTELVRRGARARRRPARRHLAGRRRARTTGAAAAAPSSTGCGRGASTPRWPAPTRSATRTVDAARADRRRGLRRRRRRDLPDDLAGRDLADALQDTAQLIKADVGTEVVADRLRRLGHAHRTTAPPSGATCRA